MGDICLITGGSRSGKSHFAETLAEACPRPRTYIATAQSTDEEMRQRILKHRKVREGRGWKTVEEPLDIGSALRAAEQSPVILLDCLTLWINNLLWEAEERGRTLAEEDVAGLCEQILSTCRDLQGKCIFVTNEIGMGIVPDNRISRVYRDLVGRCNQIMSTGADSVFLVVSGIPMQLKGTGPKTEP